MSPKAKAATADAASSSDSDDADETGILKKDLKWRPGLSGHEAKLRAKQLREASVKRSLEKKVQQEAQRQACIQAARGQHCHCTGPALCIPAAHTKRTF